MFISTKTTPSKKSSSQINAHSLDEHLGDQQAEQSVQEVHKDPNERGSYQPPDRQNDNSRGRPRSPESIN